MQNVITFFDVVIDFFDTFGHFGVLPVHPAQPQTLGLCRDFRHSSGNPLGERLCRWNIAY